MSLNVRSELIGSSMEREELKYEIDTAYYESLGVDRENDTRLAKLRERKAIHRNQVQDEPSLIDGHVTLTVRHITLGLKIRIFRDDCYFREIYSWVASLAEEPEWFHLRECTGKIIVGLILRTRDVCVHCRQRKYLGF